MGKYMIFQFHDPLVILVLVISTVPDSGGWGNGFCGSEITGNIASILPDTPCINTAQNGATTGSFVADGLISFYPCLPKLM